MNVATKHRSKFYGRRGLPPADIEAMYADYLRLNSLEKVGRLYGRSRQTTYEIFKRRGLKLNPKKFLPAIEYKGVKYTCQKKAGRHRYLRSTIRNGETYLHHVIWSEAHGPIPPGHKVAFKDGNHLNCAIDNLELLTNSEQVRKYASKGHNQFTVTAGDRLALLVGNFQSGTGTTAAGMKR